MTFVVSRSMLRLEVDAGAAFTGSRPYLQTDVHIHVSRHHCSYTRSEVSMSYLCFKF